MRGYRPYVVLRRLEAQSAEVAEGYRTRKRARSNSEEAHADEIAAWLPGWLVRPRALHRAAARTCPSSRTASSRTFPEASTRSTTSRATRRRCAACASSPRRRAGGDSPVAVQKCVALRDKNLCRVLTFAGHGDELRVYDFGAPGAGETYVAVHADAAAFARRWI